MSRCVDDLNLKACQLQHLTIPKLFVCAIDDTSSHHTTAVALWICHQIKIILMYVDLDVISFRQLIGTGSMVKVSVGQQDSCRCVAFFIDF